MLCPELLHVLLDPLLQQPIRHLHLTKGFFIVLPLRLHLLLVHSRLVLQSSHPSFQLYNPPLGLHLTRDQSSVTLLHLCPELVLLMGNILDGWSSFTAQSPGSSTMGPQTPAQPPPGPSRASNLGSVDAAATHDLPIGHRDLPWDPTGAVALFGNSDRYEWGLSEDMGLVGRRLADQFQDKDVLPLQALESGGSLQVDDDAFINAHQAENDLGDVGSAQELGGAAPFVEPDWNDLHRYLIGLWTKIGSWEPWCCGVLRMLPRLGSRCMGW